MKNGRVLFNRRLLTAWILASMIMINSTPVYAYENVVSESEHAGIEIRELRESSDDSFEDGNDYETGSDASDMEILNSYSVSRTNCDRIQRAVQAYGDWSVGQTNQSQFWNYHGKAESCHAYVNYAWKAIYGYDTYYFAVRPKTDAQKNWNNFASWVKTNARPGDILRADGGSAPHSVLIYRINENDMEYYEYTNPYNNTYSASAYKVVKTKISYADFQRKRGSNPDYFLYQIYDGYYEDVNNWGGTVSSDKTPPTITEIVYGDFKGDGGYTVSCVAVDNVGVTKVEFPTWTEKNGQDDLIWHQGVYSGGSWRYDVKSSEHNNEKGTYITHIYAWDAAGNFSIKEIITKVTEPVKGVSLNRTSIELAAGKTETLTATVTPGDATDKVVTWSSSNSSVATVNNNGVVTAKAAGTATISVTARDGGWTATCRVTVTQPVTGVYLNKTSTTLTVGQTETLTATVTPSNATNKAVTWTSSNTNVATVSTGGVLTAKAAGTATITVKTNDGGKTASCSVTVTRPESGKTAYITVDSVTGRIGDVVAVPVRITDNPGIAGAALTLTYDTSVLTLASIEKGAVFGRGTFNAQVDKGLVQWYYAESGDAITDNGVLFTARFSVRSNVAGGSYPVKVGLLDDNSANLTDSDGRVVKGSFTAGGVTISAGGVKGDLTGDGVVAMGDVVKLARAVAGNLTLTPAEELLADVTGDGVIAMGDVVKLARYVAGNLDKL